jgi:hypothetical protein
LVLQPSRNILVPYLPRSLVPEILNQFHDAPESGHMGVRKTQSAIKQRFFWNGMNKEIQQYVKSCSTCQEQKVERLKPKGLLGAVPQANSVFETIFIDFIGPLPTSRLKRNKFCLVVVDQLSSWVELFPMRVAKAPKVAEVLEDEVFCRFGSPKVIVSDNGTHFVNKVMKKLCSEWSIRHVLLSAYHPCPNRSERTNSDLVRMISSYVNNAHGNWDVHLQKFALVLRTMISDTTKFSPALLNLGREIALPIDRSLQKNESIDFEKDARDLAKILPEQLKDILNFAKDRILKAHQRNKVIFDKSRRDISFEIGQLVYVRNHELSDADSNKSKKFTKKWIGPFKILKKFEMTYIIDLPGRLNPKRHISDLKPFFPRESNFSEPPKVTVNSLVPNFHSQKSSYNLRSRAPK